MWTELVGTYPAELGYFSDCPSALELLDWCGLPRESHLDELLSGGDAAARHLADLVVAVFTRMPESCCSTAIVKWISTPAVGARLEEAFLAAETEAVAEQLASAHQLWTVC